MFLDYNAYEALLRLVWGWYGYSHFQSEHTQIWDQIYLLGIFLMSSLKGVVSSCEPAIWYVCRIASSL